MTQPRRIIHTECSNGWGGQEIRIFTEMQAMRERGHWVALLTPKNTRIYQKALSQNFPVYTFSDQKWLYPLTIARLVHLFHTVKPDVINTHSSRDGWLAGIAAKIARVPFVIRSRHIDVQYRHPALSRKMYHDFHHHIITTSQRIADNLSRDLKIPGERITSIPTGIDLNLFQSHPSGLLKQNLFIEPHHRTIGMISVLRSWKGHDDFIQAAEILSQQRNDLRFLIAGSGPRENHISQLIQKKRLQHTVFLLGHQDNVAELIAGMDVIVLPSTGHEGIPQILLQAMAMGKPVVGTDVGGIPEIVKDQETGILIPPKQPEAIAGAILRVIEDTELTRHLTENARKLIEQEFDISRMCQKLESLYDRHLS